MSLFAQNQAKQTPRKKMLVEALEQRILYSADTGALLFNHDEASQQNAEVRTVDTNSSASMTENETINQQHEIVFVDTSIEDYLVLVDDILAQQDTNRQVEIVLLDSETDGIAQINQVLSTYDEVSAIHLIGHGSEAEINLGSSALNLETMSHLYADALSNIGGHLTADADILIYGCNFGNGDDGLLAVERLSTVTGADVAASTDLTGTTKQSADWDLELSYGDIETHAVLSTSSKIQWSGTLASSTTFQEGVGGYTGTQDTHINDSTLNTPYGSDTTVYVDDNTQQALIRFDDITGAGANQIVAGSSITSATLSIFVSDTNAAKTVDVHTMLSSWSESSTWNNLSNGISTDGVEASASPIATLDAGTSGWVNIDVTADIQAIVNGGDNNGWAFVTSLNNADNWGFSSSESASSTNRPTLSVNYESAPVVNTSAGSVNYVENASPLVIDNGITLSDTDSNQLTSATVTISSHYSNGQDVLSFNNQNGITGNWDAATGTLTLSGTKIVSTYQNVIRTITYHNTSESPSTDTRTITVSVNDGTSNSIGATRDITVTQINDAGAFGGDVSATTNEDVGTAGSVTFTDSIDGYSVNNFTINTVASNGTATIDNAGNWTYSPSANYHGADSFTVQVTDDDGNVETQVINITINAISDSGTFGGDLIATTNEDVTTTGTVTFIDTADGFTTPNFTLSSNASNGSAAIDSAGNWTYTPSTNYHGADSFTVQVTDDDGNVETQVINITVNQVNDAGAFGGDVSATTNEDVATAGSVTFTDSIDGYSVNNFTINTVASSGTATIDSAGNWTYSPSANYNGSDSFTVQVTDDDGNVETQVINITINQVNDAGTFGGDLTATTNEDTPTAGTVTFTDSIDGYSVNNFTINTVASNGTATIDSAGNWTYSPSANYHGADSFTVQVTDDDGNIETQVINITVNQVNDAGTFGGDLTATTNEDTPTAGTVTFTDSIDGYSVNNFTINTVASSGTATINSAGNWTYSPSANYNGSDSFTVQVTDDDGNVETQVINITINQVNDAGTFGGDLTATTNEDTPTAGTVTFTDSIDGYTGSTFAINTVAANGTATIDSAGNWTYTPSTNYHGADSFTVQVTDDDGNVETQVINITINQVNDAGTFGGDLTATTNEDTPTAGTVTFTDSIDGYSVNNFTINTVASNGTATIDSAGNWTYSPSANYNGSDSFTVQVTDDDGNVETQVISINIIAVNDAPSLTGTQAVLANGVEDTAYIVNKSELLFGFTDVDGDVIALSNVTSSNGVITDNGTTYTITPDADFFGDITLTYQLVDGNGGITNAAISYHVNKINDAPVAEGTYTCRFEDTVGLDIFSSISGNLIATDPDDSSSTLVWSVSNGQGGFGRLTVSPNGSFTYTLNSTAINALNFGENPTDKFTVTVSDPDGATDTRTISINLIGEDDLIVTPSPISPFLPIESPNDDQKALNNVPPEILLFESNTKTSLEQNQDAITEISNSKKLAIEAAITSFLNTTDTAITNIDATSTISASNSLHNDISNGTYNNIAYTILNSNAINQPIDMEEVIVQNIEFRGNSIPFIQQSSTNNAAGVTGVAVTASAVWWALRATGLLASVITSMPAWRHVDLLAVLPPESSAATDDDNTDDFMNH